MANQVQQLPVIQWEPPKPVYTPKATPVAVAEPVPTDWTPVIQAFVSLSLIFLGPVILDAGIQYFQQQQPAPYTQVK